MAKKKGNNYIIDEENKIVKIELNRWEDENLWVIIDLDDFDKIINYPYTWYAKYSANAKGYYACASQYIPELKHAKIIYLHQFIMNANGKIVDHRSHDTLDNTKKNIQVVADRNNSTNRKSRNSNNKSGYRNVCWDKRCNKWIVQLTINKKTKCLGKFEYDELDKAGQFAEEMRQKYYGEFAGKN